MKELIKNVKSVYLKLEKSSKMYIVTLTIMFVIGISLRLWNLTSLGLNYDEAIFAYTASDILRGKIIYKDMVDNKMPYFYFTIALLFFLFGKSIIYPRLLTAFLSTFTLFFVYLIGKELYDKKVGILAAGMFVLDPLTIVWSRYTMTEPYMTFFATFAIYAYVLYRNRKKTAYLFLAGVLTGVSFFMKQPGIITFFILTACFFIDSFGREVSNKKETIVKQVFISLLGVITAILPILIYFWIYNVLGTFIQWTILRIVVYERSFFARFLVLYMVLNSNVLVWTLGLSGILFTLKRKIQSDLIALSFFLIPFVILASLQSFFDHYFLQVIPFLCILSGVILSKLLLFANQLPLKEFPYGKTALRVTIIGIIFIPYSHSFPLIFYSHAGEPLFDPNNSLIEEKKVGHYLEVNTSPGEKIFTFHPKYAFLADRENLCKYVAVIDWYILNSPNRTNILNEVLDTLVDSKVNYAVFESNVEDLQQNFQRDPDILEIINYIQGNYKLEKNIGQAFIYKYNGN